jgi:hypothetical protein
MKFSSYLTPEPRLTKPLIKTGAAIAPPTKTITAVAIEDAFSSPTYLSPMDMPIL